MVDAASVVRSQLQRRDARLHAEFADLTAPDSHANRLGLLDGIDLYIVRFIFAMGFNAGQSHQFREDNGINDDGQ